MTLDWRKYWWQPGFVLVFFAVDVPYWLFPYNKLNLPDAQFIVAMVASGIAKKRAPPDEPAP